MSRATAKGTFAETAVMNYLNSWCTTAHPDVDWQARGLPFYRERSRGAQDRGDVFGPYTMIEVKNYTNPPLGSLLSNAEWKAGNAARPVWCLCWKTKGDGVKSVHRWGCAMTLGQFRHLLTDADRQRFDGSECFDDVTFDHRTDWGVADHPARLHTVDRRCLTGTMDGFLHHVIDSDGGVADMAETIPFIVVPRRGSGGHMLEQRRWYVVTNLGGFGRLLESLSILPVRYGGATTDESKG